MPHLESDQEEGASVVADTLHSDLFQFAPVGYLIVDCKGHICDVNQTAVQLLGMDRDQLLADGPFSVFVHPDDQEQWLAHTRYVVRHQQKHGIDLRLKRPDNSEFFARVECSPHFDADQKGGRFLMVILDITDRVESEIAMTKSEMQYRALFESIDEGYCIIEVLFDENLKPVDYRFLEINPAFEKQTGLGDALGKRMRELAPEHEDHWFEMYGRIALTGQAERFQQRAEQLGRWYDGYAFRIGNPEKRQVAILFNDITEHKLADQLLKESEANLALLAHKLEQRVQQRTAELQESEGRFRTLFEESPDACFLLDLDGGFVDGNKELERQIGYTREELVRQNVFTSSIFPAPAREIARERIARLARGEHTGPIEYCLVRKDGSSIDVEVTSMLLHIGGRPVLLSSSRDLTARKKAEAERETLARQRRLALDAANLGWWHYDPQSKDCSYDRRYAEILGVPDLETSIDEILKLIHPDDLPAVWKKVEAALDPNHSSPYHAEYRIIRSDGELRWIEAHGHAVFEGEGRDCRAVDFTGTVADITESRQLREALEKRILALTRPLDHSEDIAFDNLFERKQLQLLQDQFSRATGVASVITLPDGTPITAPSNYTDLCELIIHQTGNGCADCYQSAANQSEETPLGPIVNTCLSGALWDAAASIEVDGKHVANWFIGQVRNETQTEEQITAYARKVGIDEAVLLEAFHQLPVMSRERFEYVVQALHTLANQLSTAAYQNVQQARFIEAQKKAEAALRESEERFRMVYEHAVIGVAIADTQTGCFVQCNPAFCALVGYAEHELKGVKVSELIHPAELEHHRHLVAQLRSGNVPYFETDSRYTHKNGNPVWVHKVVSFLPAEPGQPLRVMALVADITERRIREKALRESEARYRKLFETESDAIIIFDNQTRQFVDVNDAAIELYGYSREEFMGMSYDELTMEPDASYLAIEALLEGTISSVSNRMHRKKDGTIIPVDISGATFKWKGQTLLCGICRDISEQLDRENELRNNREELRHLASELSLSEQRERQRIASELHDGISQLLSSAYLRLDTLRQTGITSESAGQALERVCEIIDQTLKETRSLTFELSCPLLNELGLAASLEQLCSAMTRDYGIHLEYVGMMQPVPVSPDHKFIIFRAVRELLMNVLKHSQANRALVKMECRDGQASVVVEDDGRGFDTSKAGMGFSPSGGFGLFSIGEYIRHAGGELEICSIPEGGTRATFFVPLEV